jgi:CheY-like chemotaxis protein
LSHELRTPLTAILGWTQILAGKSDPDRSSLARGLEVIERNTRMQAQMISDLLDIARLTSGKVAMNTEAVDIAALIEGTIDSVELTAKSKGISLVRDLAPRLGAVLGDPTRLQQIAWNLLSNAIKFTGRGGTVSISLRSDGDGVRMAVADTGAGIKPEFMPFLFERFRQANASSRRLGGLGLGLAIVKQLVELHGGTVWASSEGEGRGATFFVRLPLASEEAIARAETDASSEESFNLAGGAWAGVTVLLVEDDLDTREMMERLLGDAGAEVVTAELVPEAMEKIRDRHPDLIVSDIGLPGEGGYAFIERLRRLGPGEGGAIPAIAVTAFARAEERRRALRAGFQAHVAKPINPGELLAVAASFANIVRTRRESELAAPP